MQLVSIQAAEVAFSIITSIISTFLGVIVFSGNPKGATNRLFLLLSLFIDVYIVVNFLSLHPPVFTPENQLFWIRVVMFVCSFIGPTLLLLVHTFPKEKVQISKKYLVGLVFLMLASAAASMTNLVFKDIQYPNGQALPVPGYGIPIFFVDFVGLFILSFVLLIYKYRKAVSEEKKKLFYLLTGVIVSFSLMAITTVIFVVILKTSITVFLGPIFPVFLMSCIAYAIIRYQMFNIKLIAVQILAGLLLLVVIVGISTIRLFNYTYFQLFFLALIITLGVFLVKYINKEIRAREHAVNLSNALQNANALLEELSGQREELLLLVAGQLKDSQQNLVLDSDIKKHQSVFNKNDRFIKLAESFNHLAILEKNGVERQKLKNVDMNQFVEELLTEYSKIFMEKKLHVELEKSKTARLAEIDADKIRLVMEKLLDNAIRYSPPNSKIAVCVRAEDEGVAIWIKDEGIGFTCGEWDDLYGKFYRSRQAVGAHPTGTGLSLFLSKKIIEAHGGRVWAQSYGYKKGAEFGFWIPYRF